nr:immunoglobulin heavy chain junction region [Macaca mulatta]MOX61179.1 immunoglobulin heavy chain junction region [Macaca mulatta]MOX61332.1 immunoglobulin heavy chain junction region [Macaca mulatta]MOX62261.1 immunoglobulin heavy chain junction region [Macaca mulatta]MOX63036.1 immunoglobulin heavy chain junction region [Macaca mulatta]
CARRPLPYEDDYSYYLGIFDYW